MQILIFFKSNKIKNPILHWRLYIYIYMFNEQAYIHLFCFAMRCVLFAKLFFFGWTFFTILLLLTEEEEASEQKL